ncbi:hypothetical protein [Microbispora sp. NBC_01389]|uniref:hypothetical protein n=1 Tax=Microbispora sp. NBC_01389 TaxID=2903584 RepID=UPI00324A8193
MLETLIEIAGTTVVAAMATNAWDYTREKVITLFRRDQNEQRLVEALLDHNNSLLAAASDVERARQDVAPLWRLQLKTLLEQHPDAAAEIQVLVDEIQSLLPQRQQNWVQQITARDHGHAYGAMGGDVNVYHAGPAQVRPPNAAASDGTR